MTSENLDPSRLVSIKELSQSANVPVVTLRRWARQGKIPYYQPGGKNGRLFFPADAIQASESTSPASERSTPQAGRTPRWMS